MSVTAAQRRVLGPVRWKLAGANALVAVSSGCAVLPFLLIVEVARRLLAGGDDGIWPLVAWAVAGLAARALLYSGALMWTHLIDADNQLRLSELIADKLRRVPLGWFSSRNSAEVKKLLHNDLESIHYLIAHAQVEFTAALTVPLFSLVYLFWVDWRVAAVLLAPIIAYTVALFFSMGGDYQEKLAHYQELEQQTEAATIEFVDGIQVVRTFGQARRAHRRFQESVDRFADFQRDWVTPMTRIEALSSVLLNPACLLALVLLVGLPLISGGHMAAVDLLPFTLLGLGLGSTILTVGNAVTQRRAADAATLRVDTLLQTPELMQHAPDPAQAVVPAGPAGQGVAFEDVHFAYREGQEVLRDISLRLRPGTITALVGPSGSGKSTLASLLPRFADPTSGRITLDGRDIRELPTAELYRRVGFVFQDVRLLRDTVRANIALGHPEASDADVAAAAHAAQIHERITELPKGYDSVVGRDVHFSGGEAQRLSIARALLADAPVLVLDEATAFADAESEALIQDAIATLVQGRTVLVIAHRLHTITGVDEIVVLARGEIIEQGTHPELLAADGTYAGLWQANEEARIR